MGVKDDTVLLIFALEELGYVLVSNYDSTHLDSRLVGRGRSVSYMDLSHNQIDRSDKYVQILSRSPITMRLVMRSLSMTYRPSSGQFWIRVGGEYVRYTNEANHDGSVADSIRQDSGMTAQVLNAAMVGHYERVVKPKVIDRFESLLDDHSRLRIIPYWTEMHQHYERHYGYTCDYLTLSMEQDSQVRMETARNLTADRETALGIARGVMSMLAHFYDDPDDVWKVVWDKVMEAGAFEGVRTVAQRIEAETEVKDD